VAEGITNVNAVSDSISSVNTVSGSIVNTNTVAASIENINTVAPNISNVNTVAGIADAVTNVSDNVIDINQVSNDRNLAQSAAIAAAASEAQAEAARDAAFDNADVYASTAAGLAGVALGEQFQIVSADGQTVLRYRHDAGPVATLVASYPVAGNDVFSAIKYRPESGGQQIASIADPEGYAAFVVKKDGSFGTEHAELNPDGMDAQNGAIVFEDDAAVKLRDASGFWGYDSSQALEIRQDADGTILEIQDTSGYSALRVADTEFAAKTPSPPVAALQYRVRGPSVTYNSHRGVYLGNTVAPENSIDALYLASRAGYSAVETDMRETSDGQWVIIHDETIDRTLMNSADYTPVTGSVAVSSLTLSQLRTNYVLKADNPAHRKPIPTLQEYLKACVMLGIHPIIENKQPGLTNQEMADRQAIFESVCGPGGYTVADSNSVNLDYIRSISASAKLLYYGVWIGPGLTATQEQMLAHVATKQPAMLGLDYTTITTTTQALSRQYNVPLVAWTVPASFHNALVNLGVASITTDQIPPDNSRNPVLFSSIGSAGMRTNGTVSGNTLTLTSGQVAEFVGGPSIQLGAYFSKFLFKGAATVVGANISRVLSIADWEILDFRALFAGTNPGLRIIAGTGGCQISEPAFTVTTF
jgi:glycerophosphoryl diester phosphodiesterase